MTSWQTHAVAGWTRLAYRRGMSTRERGMRRMEQPRDPAPVPRRLRPRVIRRHVGGWPVDRVMPAPGVALRPGAAVVYVHGGSFVHGVTRQHWQLAADLADATGAPVYLPHYGRAPQHTVDDLAPLMDAVLEHVTVWDGAGDGTPRVRVHLAGDSAGGAIALLTAQRRRGDDRVVGLTLVAPALDLAMTNPAIDAVEPHDPWLARPGLRPQLAAWAGRHDVTDPAVSPVRGDLSGLPPVHVFVGARDICYPDAVLLRDRAAAATPPTAVTLHVADGSPHVHVLLPTPEGRGDRATLLGVVAASFS